jgi:hypothetical protein
LISANSRWRGEDLECVAQSFDNHVQAWQEMSLLSANEPRLRLRSPKAARRHELDAAGPELQREARHHR